MTSPTEQANKEFLKSNYEVIDAAKKSITTSGSGVIYRQASGNAAKEVLASINKRIENTIKEKKNE